MNQKKIRFITLTSSILAAFLGPFMVSSINIALPAIEKSFKADAVTLSWVATSYLLSYAIFLVPFGKLSDIYGRKKNFTLGLTIFSLSSLGAALSPSIDVLLLFRFIQGLGSAMITTTAVSMLISVYPPEERGKVLGLVIAAVYVGLSAGPFFGGILTHHFGWQSLFILMGPIGIIDVIFICIFLKGEWADAAGEKFDYVGSLLYGAFLILLMRGISRLNQSDYILYIGTSIIFLTLFIKQELSTKNPVMDLRLYFKNRTFGLSNLAALINYASTFAVVFCLSLYLQYAKGMTPQAAGVILVIQPLIQAVLSPLTGKLSDRLEPRFLASAGMGLCFLGLAMLSFLHIDSSEVFIITILIILGCGFALFSSPNMNSIMSAVPRRYYGIASSSAGTMRLLGQMSSMAMATILFSLIIGPVRISRDVLPQFMESIQHLFIIFAALSAVGIVFSLARGTIHNKD